MQWYEKAIQYGWPRNELVTLWRLLKSRHHTTCVEMVLPESIMLTSRSVLRISGVGRDGRTYVSEIPHARQWFWRRNQIPTSVHGHKKEEKSDWCPAHGYQCARIVPGCAPAGTPHFIAREIEKYFFGSIERTPPAAAPRHSRPPIGRGKLRKNPRQLYLALPPEPTKLP